MTLRDYLPTDRDVRKSIERSEQTGFRLAAQGVFILLLLAFVVVSVAAEFVLVAVLASFVVGLMLRAALPADSFMEWVGEYSSGEAGDRWRRRVDRWKTKARRFR